MKNADIRLSRLLTAAACLPLLGSCGGQSKPDEQKEKGPDGDKATEKPNIVIFYTDQQQWDALSIAGNDLVETPNMDRLAQMGVRFEQSICNQPVSGPSRACLLTGLMASQAGVNYNDDELKPGLRTMGEIFRDAGYQTIWAGKWHLPEMYPARFNIKEVQGFDVLPFFDTAATKIQWITGEYADSALSVAVNDYLRNRPEKPFLLAISYHNPHDICGYPHSVGQVWKDRSQNAEGFPELPVNHEIPDDEIEFMTTCRKREHYGNQSYLVRDYDDEDWRRYRWSYYRMVEMVDREIGKVLEVMEDEGMMDNTLIIFTSDHGECAGAHHFACKHVLWEEALRVPLVFYYKGHIEGGQTDVKHLTQSLDILPTMCDYAGLECPKEVLGTSLRPIIENPEADWRNFVVAELAPDRQDHSVQGRMIRTLDWKYNVYSHGEKNEQLFDLKNDPGETTNLAYDPEYAEVKAKLRQQLKDYLQETGNDFEFKE